jgi:hypothetical protein
MGRAHALVVLAAIAGGTGLWVGLSLDEAPVPLDLGNDTRASTEPTQPKPDGDAARARVQRPVDAPPEPVGSGEPSTIPAPPAEAGTVELLVRDLAGRQAVAAFRWRFLQEDAEPRLGTGQHGAAALHLPRAATGRLFVEAEGMEPAEQELRVPAAGAPPLRVELFLAPRATASGVVLDAKDDRGGPVTRLRLDLWKLPTPQQTPVLDDPEGEPLWKRTFAADDGLFRLTALAAGDYALRAQPVDEHGVALPLQPWRHAFSFAGHEAVPLVAEFRPGVVLSIAAETGAPLVLRATVTTAAGPRPVWWRSRRGEETPVVGIDVVELPGRATTLLALPPGDYAVALQHDGVPVALHAAPLPAAASPGVRAFTAVLPH